MADSAPGVAACCTEDPVGMEQTSQRVKDDTHMLRKAAPGGCARQGNSELATLCQRASSGGHAHWLQPQDRKLLVTAQQPCPRPADASLDTVAVGDGFRSGRIRSVCKDCTVPTSRSRRRLLRWGMKLRCQGGENLSSVRFGPLPGRNAEFRCPLHACHLGHSAKCRSAKV